MTSLLTLEEIVQIELSLRKYCEPDKYDLSLSDFARAIEAAVIRKLSAGVSVEPSYTTEQCLLDRSRDCCRSIHCNRKVDVFTLPQLQTERAEARVRAIQDCDDVVSELSHDASRGDCGQAIRALLGKEPT